MIQNDVRKFIATCISEKGDNNIMFVGVAVTVF